MRGSGFVPNNTSDCETVNMAIHAVYKVAVSICIIQLSVAAATSCNIGTVARCDNITDDTAAIQAVLDTCSRDMQLIVFPGNRTCLTQPLNLSSHTAIWFEPSAVLRAGDKVFLPRCIRAAFGLHENGYYTLRFFCHRSSVGHRL